MLTEFLCISSMFLKAGWLDELRPGMVWHREFWVQRDLPGKFDPNVSFGALELTFAIVVTCIGWKFDHQQFTKSSWTGRAVLGSSTSTFQVPWSIDRWIVGKTIIGIIGRFSSYLLKLMRHAPLWGTSMVQQCLGLWETCEGQTFVKVQLLTPKSEGPNSFSWLTEVQSKCQPDTFAKKQWQDSSRGPLMSWWSTCVQNGGWNQGVRALWIARRRARTCESKGECHKAFRRMIFSWFAEKRRWSCSDENDRMPYAMRSLFFASNVLFFDVFCRLGLLLAELHPEHHVAGRIRENPRKCLRESVMSRWIPVRARRAIPPLTTAIITWPVKRAEVRHRTHRRWVWNGVNMAYFFLKPFLVCPKVLTAIREESHHFLDKWAYLNLFGIVWHFGHCHDLLFRTFSISERLQTVFCLIVSGPVSLVSQILS